MAEQKPTPQDYAREAKYQESLLKHSQDFDRLVQTVPEDREDLRGAMESLYHVEPDKLLDPEKLKKMKQDNEPMFREVSTYYMNFLKNVLGLD